MKNEYQITWDIYKTWLKENMLRGIKIAFILTWFAIGVGIIITCIVKQQPIYIILAAFCFYRTFLWDYFSTRKKYKNLSQKYGKGNWTRTISFLQNELVLSEADWEARYTYADIIDLKEKDNKIWLTLNDKRVIRMYKDKFVNTTWEECKNKIEMERDNSSLPLNENESADEQ